MALRITRGPIGERIFWLDDKKLAVIIPRGYEQTLQAKGVWVNTTDGEPVKSFRTMRGAIAWTKRNIKKF